MGDLNVNMLSTSNDSVFIWQLVCKFNFKLVEHGAIHLAEDSHTRIDVILTDEDNLVLDAGNQLARYPSRHNIIDVNINFQSTKTSAFSSFTYRDFKSIKRSDLFLIPLIGRPSIVLTVE